jgi:hypothetical protein
MKNITRVGILLPILLLAVTAIRCSENCSLTSTQYYWEPVYMSFEELRSSVESTEPIELSSPGKIYFKDNYLYVNESGKGIHVIDNSNPAAPVAKSFITIPGNYDLAIRNNILYADSYVDLVAIDISHIGEEEEISRVENMFTYYTSMNFFADPVRGVVSDLREVKNVNTNATDCNSTWMPGGWRMYESYFVMADASAQTFAKSFSSGGSSTGTSGSLARFAINGNLLYALDASQLKGIDVSDPNAITLKSNTQLAWDIETIFPVQDKLFIGSQSGMHIIDVSNPEAPTRLSTYSHLVACDPVVVEGNFAYVTLRTGNACTGTLNQLEVIDISDLTAPRFMKAYPMTNPHGLGIDNGTLFVCDGEQGLRVLDANNNLDITQIAQYKDLRAVDLIPLGGVAMVIGSDGLYQYDYTNLNDIRLLSKLHIKSND